MENNTSPSLPGAVRWFAVIIGSVSLLGTTLIWAQGVLMPIWPEILKPFNARFFGATYFGILAYVYFLLRYNRHDPGRLVLTLSFVFSGMVALITIFHCHEFLWERRIGTTGWFIFYYLPTFWAGWYLWKYRNAWNIGRPVAFPGWLKNLLLIQAVVSCVQGITLALAGQIGTSFWPWQVDPFHARAYSGIFLALGIGAWMLLRGAGQMENRAMGWGQGTIAVVVLSGFAYTDSLLHKVNWSSPGTMLWLAYFIFLLITGLAILQNERKTSAGEPE